MLPKKSLGQNFLYDQGILNLIIKNGEIKNDDIILEIGPGTGNLTEQILKKNPKKIIVVEKDKYLSEKLEKKFGEKITIINKDILDCYNELKFTKPIKVFGNLPYNISTKILTSFINLEELDKNYLKFIFIFQKEVAERIIAKFNTKQYGRLSILTSWKMNCLKLFDIAPRFFYPAPKVWSSLIVLTPKKKIELLKKSKSLEHVTNIFFNQRRKMIRKPIKQLFSNHEKIANELKLDLNLRPQNLSVNKYIEISKLYEKLI